MHKILQITATLERPDLLKDLVEKLADRRYDIGYGNTPVPASWKAIEISSVETYVNGTIALAEGNEKDAVQVNMPFTTSFIFTCFKDKGSAYTLSWASSLS